MFNDFQGGKDFQVLAEGSQAFHIDKLGGEGAQISERLVPGRVTKSQAIP